MMVMMMLMLMAILMVESDTEGMLRAMLMMLNRIDCYGWVFGEREPRASFSRLRMLQQMRRNNVSDVFDGKKLCHGG